jgi:hypothetical protein
MMKYIFFSIFITRIKEMNNIICTEFNSNLEDIMVMFMMDNGKDC